MALFRSKSSPRQPPPIPPAVSEGSPNGQSAAAPQRTGQLDSATAADLAQPSDSELEPAVQQIGSRLLEQAREHKAGVLSAAFWSDKLMNWTMKDENFKVQFFRFV